MMKTLILVLFTLSSTCFAEHRQRIVIIDSGLNKDQLDSYYLCDDAPYKSFGTPLSKTPENAVLDVVHHGEVVFDLVTKNVSVQKYCVTFVKVEVTYDATTQKNLLDALRYSTMLKPRFFNMSFSSIGIRDIYEELEAYYLKEISEHGIVTIPAGNHNLYLSKSQCVEYPACHFFQAKNIHVVGSYKNVGTIKESKEPYSNWGEYVTDKADGSNVCYKQHCASGTSFSAPKILNKFLTN